MNQKFNREIKIINAVAPIRICDFGGWTDTWFAEHGRVLNIAVYPYVQCQLKIKPVKGRTGKIVIYAENYGDRYSVNPANPVYDRHPLLEAAIYAMKIPRDIDIEITIYSEAPAGCSTGTSASVSIALIGALSVLIPNRMTCAEVAVKAHEIETIDLGLQCGVQDQIAAAYGGICYIEIPHYPFARVSQIHLPDSIWWELESRICLFYLGKSHKSSEIHNKVIHEIQNSSDGSKKLEELRKTPIEAKDALYSGDFKRFGRVMIHNTELQAELHQELVSSTAKKIFEVAKKYGAIGWKVNGAGGDGGSVTILSSAVGAKKREMIQAIESISPEIKYIPIYLSRYGLRVWESKI